MREATVNERQLARLYDRLARYNWIHRRFRRPGRSRTGEGLEMHKRLTPPGQAGEGPAAGTAGLDAWLLGRLAPAPGARLLDAGCGFGASLFAFLRHVPTGQAMGLSLSPYQIRRAREEARRLGLGERCRLLEASFDDPTLPERLAAPVDLVLSIETLFHSPDVGGSLGILGRCLAPGGRLVLVEDMAIDDDVETTRDGRELRQRWSTQRLHSDAAYRRALRHAGLELEQEVDLSAQVERRSAAQLEASRRRLDAWRRRVPLAWLRGILDAYLGGLALERLYAQGHMQYRVIVARRSA